MTDKQVIKELKNAKKELNRIIKLYEGIIDNNNYTSVDECYAIIANLINYDELEKKYNK